MADIVPYLLGDTVGYTPCANLIQLGKAAMVARGIARGKHVVGVQIGWKISPELLMLGG